MTEIKSQIVHPGELAQFPANSNTHGNRNIEELAESRRQFGQFKNAVVWSPSEEMIVTLANGDEATLKPGLRYVIAGEGFWKGSLRRRDDGIEVKDFSHLTYEEAILLGEADNASALGSKINPEQMRENLDRVRGLMVNNERLTSMLQRARDVVGVVENGKSPPEATQIDRAEQLQEKWRVEVGDLWQIGEHHRVICGDCLDVMDEMLSCDFDMILSDLPYGTTSLAWDNIIPLELLWDRYKRISKPDGVVVLTADEPFTSILICSNLKWFKYRWVWRKDKAANFGVVKKRPLNVTEDVVIFSGNTPRYFPKMWDSGKVSNKGGRGESVNRFGYGKALAGWSHRNTTEKYPTNILEFATPKHNDTENKSLHPTQKPVSLFSYLIQTYTKPDELILDNAAGAGTTGMAAHQEGRRSVMIEVLPRYCAVILERFEQAGLTPAKI